ncbi:unnamed protein product [Mesocestoides corti]|uniref:RanBD1 domain-containing protein n=1 Tax=Mesocestoides corti TaxID=53468 RepID=A0A0R3U7F7_MESCO|nr:unnamed protein product [Mesocestoides corti]
MGAKESQLQDTVADHHTNNYGRVKRSHLRTLHAPATSSNKLVYSASSPLLNNANLKNNLANPHRGQLSLNELSTNPIRQPLSGDIYSHESKLGGFRMPAKSCGDETGTDGSQTRALSTTGKAGVCGVRKISTEKAAHGVKNSLDALTRGRSFDFDDESDTSSSSLSLEGASVDAFLKNLKQRPKKSSVLSKKPNDPRGGETRTSTEEFCTSELSSSTSSPLSCCTPKPVVDFAKLKKADVETKKAKHEQVQATKDVTIPLPEQPGPSKTAQINQKPANKVDPKTAKIEGISKEAARDRSKPCSGWVTPKPSPKFGFTQIETGEVFLTAYLREQTAGTGEYAKIKKRSERSLKGLQCQQDCQIKLYDETTEWRTFVVHKIRIRGPGYREVIRCKNSLPRCISEHLITAHSNVDELLLSKGRRK